MLKLLPLLLSLLVFQAKALHKDFNRVKIIGEWEKIYSSQGNEIFIAEVANSSFKAFRARGTLEGDISIYLTLFRNIETMKKWSPHLITKYAIEEISDIEAITYQADDIPWPAQDRDMVLKNKLYLDKKNKMLKVLTYSIDHPSHPRKEEYIRAEIQWAVFTIRPKGKDKTLIDFMIHADPKGSIPSWIVNNIQRNWPLKFLKSAEKAARKISPNVKPGVYKLFEKLLHLK